MPAAPRILSFAEVTPETLSGLYKAVYGDAEGMAESFSEKFPSPDDFLRYRAGFATDAGALGLVFAEDAALLGFATLRPRRAEKLRHTADLSMGVDPAMRGRGIGRQLLGVLLEQARAAGLVSIVYLMVRADNAAAVRLYREAGFETLACLEADTRIGDRYYDGLLMRRFLHLPGC